jgi:DNA-binding Xre family transcriptional regulator
MVGDKIKQLVDNQQVMNRHEVAEKMGISENNLYRLYKRESVETKYLLCLCDIFNVSINYFFNNESPVIENTKVSTKISSKKDDASNVFYERLLEEKDKRIGFLEEDVKFYKNIINNQFREKGSSQSLGKNEELEHSQPNSPTGQAPTFSGEAAAAGK